MSSSRQFPIRPFRFGIQASNLPTGKMGGTCKKTEALGYSALTMPDHFTEQLARLH